MFWISFHPMLLLYSVAIDILAMSVHTHVHVSIDLKNTLAEFFKLDIEYYLWSKTFM